MWMQSFVIIFVMFSITCEHTDSDSSRKKRFLTFNNVDDNLRIELTFTVPFITIPTKKTMNSIYGVFGGDGVPSININPASLAIGGFLIFASTFVLPFIIKNHVYRNHDQKYSRVLEDAQFSSDAFLEAANGMLSDGKMLHACAMKVACWAGRRSGSDYIRFWHHLKSNPLVSSVFNATAIDEAMLSGRKELDCSSYSPCLLKEEQFPAVMDSLERFIRSVR